MDGGESSGGFRGDGVPGNDFCGTNGGAGRLVFGGSNWYNVCENPYQTFRTIEICKV
jgi:hypothetical protein